MSGCSPWESELCVATQGVWVSSCEDELFAATQEMILQCTLIIVMPCLGVDPRSVPQDLEGNWLAFYCWHQPELEVELV